MLLLVSDVHEKTAQVKLDKGVRKGVCTTVITRV